MSEKIRVGGYVKLAKLWEKRRDAALSYHRNYYSEKYRNSEIFELADVYVDITGNKHIVKRPEMVRLLSDCLKGRVECIAVQTRAYLAADTREFSYLFHFLRDAGEGIDIITEDKDYNINTILNRENQTEELERMARKLILLNPKDHGDWKKEIIDKIKSFEEER